jgi:HlyD family type I secretion membrane fusion protein
MWIGIAIVGLFFVLGGGWAATAPLSGAIIAHGLISPDSSRQTVQHLEGGIIRDIRVREGDRVSRGDVLITLADVGPQASVGAQMTQLRALAAAEARLQAERNGADTVTFQHPALADRRDPEVQLAINQQVRLFETRRANDRTQSSILTQRIAQLEQQIAGAERQLEGVRRQKALIREELKGVEELFRKGYERKPRMLELQRTEAGLIGTEGELVSRIARSQEQIGETRIQIVNLRDERLENVNKELSEVQTKRTEIEQTVKEGVDRLARTTITAPVNGTVLDLRFKTRGGVIKPGDPVLDIVPSEDELIIDARVSPKDIDQVHQGQPAYVMFPSYPQRNMLRVPAKVRHVSADSMQDQRTGEHFYTSKIEIDRAILKELDPHIELKPGLPAEAYLSTGERTFFEYILQPFLMVVERGMRE